MWKRGLLLPCLILMTAGAWSAPIEWVKDYPTALKQAGEKDQLVMLDAYTDWCTWCKKLDAETYTDAKVQNLSKQFVCLKLNAEQDTKTAEKYGVDGFPTILFLTSTGEEVHRIEGYLPADAFLAEMQSALDQEKEFRDLKAQAKLHPDDIDVAFRLALIHLDRGQIEAAAPLAEKVLAADSKNEKGKAAPLLVKRGIAYGRRSNFGNAAADFQRVIKDFATSKDVEPAQYFLAVTNMLQNKSKDALDILDHIVSTAQQAEWKDRATRLRDQIKSEAEQAQQPPQPQAPPQPQPKQ